MNRETPIPKDYEVVHPVEQAVLDHEPTIGSSDISVCLPGWIKSFCVKFEEKTSWELSHAQVNAICHTLIAARVRQHRLVNELAFARAEINGLAKVATRDRIALGEPCRGCGEPLKEENKWMIGGCPCNSSWGVNDKLSQ